MQASAEPLERAAALRDLKLFGRESRQFFIASWPLLHGNVGPTFARYHDASTNGLGDHKPKRSKKSNRNFTVTGMSMSCLDRARTANFGYIKFTTKNNYLSLEFELDCDSQLNNPRLPTL